MKVTIEVGSSEEAVDMLKGNQYVAFLGSFYQYLLDAGREENAQTITENFKSLALIHGVTVT